MQDMKVTLTRREQLARFTPERLCERIFQRHGAEIRVKKPQVAVANLVRIVEAFLVLAARKGFHATTLRDLADASGLSMGGLYSYFDSKETLVVMVLEEVDHAAAEMLSFAPAEIVADPQAHLSWVIDAHVRLTEAMLPWFVFAFMEAKSLPKTVRKVAVESELATENAIAGILARGVSAGVFSVDDTQLAASLIKPLLQDWYVKRAKYRKRGVSIDRYIETVVQFATAAVTIPEGKAGRG